MNPFDIEGPHKRPLDWQDKLVITACAVTCVWVILMVVMGWIA
jgi:hypothetical protein